MGRGHQIEAQACSLLLTSMHDAPPEAPRRLQKSPFIGNRDFFATDSGRLCVLCVTRGGEMCDTHSCNGSVAVQFARLESLSRSNCCAGDPDRRPVATLPISTVGSAVVCDLKPLPLPPYNA